MLNRLKPVTPGDRRLCIALNNIRSKCNIATSDEAVFIQWLVDGLEETRKKNDIQQDVLLKWNQGACQILDEILESLQTAKELLKNN